MLSEDGKNLTKLSMIENAVNEMIAVRGQIAELKESEVERQAAMKILQADEKKFRTIVENIPQKMFMKDKNSVYLFANGRLAADFKMKPEDISGKTDYDLFPKELAEKYVADDKRIMATGQLENIEEDYVLEGQTFFVHTVKTPVKDEKGEIVGVLGVFGDITGQKRDQEELRKNCEHLENLLANREADLEAVNQQLQREIAQRGRVKQQLQELDEMFWALFENTGTATVMIEENMIISLANKEFEKLSGIHKEELEWEKCLTQFLDPEGLDKIKAFYLSGRTNRDAALREYECQFAGRGRDLKNIRITAAMVPGSPKAVVSLMDITEPKRAEESIRDWEKKYQTLAGNIHEAVLILQDGWLKYGNPRIFNISGYAEKELTSKPFEEFIPKEEQGTVEEHLEKLRSGQSPQVYPIRLIHKNGNIRWMENRAVLIQWQKRPAVLNLMTDLTDRKKVEKELRDSVEVLRGQYHSLEKIIVVLNRE